MFTWLAANLSTIIISAILLAIVIAVLRNSYKQSKKGQCIGCDCACSGKNNCCHCAIPTQQNK